MRSRTGRMAHLATKVSVAATMALVLAMLGAMLPRRQRRLVSGR